MQYTDAKHALVLLCTTNQFLVITTKALNWNEEEFEKLKSEPLTTEMDDEAVIVFQVSNSASSLAYLKWLLQKGRNVMIDLRMQICNLNLLFFKVAVQLSLGRPKRLAPTYQ